QRETRFGDERCVEARCCQNVGVMCRLGAPFAHACGKRADAGRMGWQNLNACRDYALDRLDDPSLPRGIVQAFARFAGERRDLTAAHEERGRDRIAVDVDVYETIPPFRNVLYSER